MFFSGTSGSELSDLYLYAWEAGLKTTYYLRSLGASQVEKSTIDAKGTQTRAKNGGPEKMSDMQQAASALQASMSPVEVAPLQQAILSPIATPSPLTKEMLANVEEKMMAPKKPIKLHVAEEAICESCQ
jgi:ribonucleoside-diphosphate reductase alpha chain